MYSKHATKCIDSFNFHIKCEFNDEVGTSILILQIRKLRLEKRKVTCPKRHN